MAHLQALLRGPTQAITGCCLGCFLQHAIFHQMFCHSCHGRVGHQKPPGAQAKCVATQESMRTSAGTPGAAAPPSALQVGQRHFEAAMRRVAPSVSRKDQRVYDQLRRSLRSTRGHLDATVSSAMRQVQSRTFAPEIGN